MTELEEFERTFLGLLEHYRLTFADFSALEEVPDLVDDVSKQLLDKGISVDEINKSRKVIYAAYFHALETFPFALKIITEMANERKKQLTE